MFNMASSKRRRKIGSHTFERLSAVNKKERGKQLFMFTLFISPDGSIIFLVNDGCMHIYTYANVKQ